MRPETLTDPDIAAAAALIGDRSRAAILAALADGRALPSGELARAAGISPQTASSHLDKLFKAHVLAVQVQGRHHYYRLRDTRIADLLESLAAIARPAPSRTTVQRDEAERLRFARTCYGHLAGRLGVAVARALAAKALLTIDDVGCRLTRDGEEWFRAIGVDVGSLRRPLARHCLDWSERRHHIAGPLGVALTARMIDLGWLSKVRGGRALRWIFRPTPG
jgi:DNA-binding transcriptional ArsR family regulator